MSYCRANCTMERAGTRGGDGGSDDVGGNGGNLVKKAAVFVFGGIRGAEMEAVSVKEKR